VVEKVGVTGWRVQIHLKIPLPEDVPTTTDDSDPSPTTDRQAVSACVPFVSVKRDSYSLKERDFGRVTPVEN
jgi:hypothetical protein